MTRTPLPQYAILLVIFILIVAVVWVHLWQLASIPRGLYVDETSIGINAVRIAQGGVDEHGEVWPIFFKAFGEYKNPLYIYASSFIFWLAGPSVFGLRLTSALFFFVFLAGLAGLSWQLFRRPLPTVFVVASAAALPWFFPLSRIAFEVISQLTVTIFVLLFLYLAHHEGRSRRTQLVYAFLAGACLAATVYAYSTSRLLAFASLALWAIMYARQAKRHFVAGVLGFALVLIPYVTFSITHPGALTSRFATISYLSDPNQTVAEKTTTFVATYLYHLSPKFLLLAGDSNLRHATGHGGALFASVFVLAIVGVVTTLTNKEGNRKFALFLLLLALVSPVPAALTLLDGGITTRTLLFGLMWVVFAGYGIAFLARYHRAIAYALSVLLVIEAGAYLNDYFRDYGNRSLIWFETYNLEGALRTALAQHPQRVMVSPNAHQAATNLAFYQATIPNPDGVSIVLSPPDPAPSTCLIFFTPEDETAVNTSLLPFRDLTPPDSMAKLRCYD